MGRLSNLFQDIRSDISHVRSIKKGLSEDIAFLKKQKKSGQLEKERKFLAQHGTWKQKLAAAAAKKYTMPSKKIRTKRIKRRK